MISTRRHKPPSSYHHFQWFRILLFLAITATVYLLIASFLLSFEDIYANNIETITGTSSSSSLTQAIIITNNGQPHPKPVPSPSSPSPSLKSTQKYVRHSLSKTPPPLTTRKHTTPPTPPQINTESTNMKGTNNNLGYRNNNVTTATPWWWRSVNEKDKPPWTIWRTVDFEESTIHKFGQTWNTATHGFIAAIKEGTIGTKEGMVFNRTKAWTFSKWYWKKDEGKANNNNNLQTDPLKYLSLVAIFNQDFQHIPFDTLPKMLMACPFLHTHKDVQVMVMNDLQRDMVRELCKDIATHRFHSLKKLPYKAAAIYIPHFERNDGAELKMGLTCSKRCIPSLGSQDKSGTEVLYLPRKGPVRRVANELEVLTALRKIWPNIISYTMKNNWREDRSQLERARVIIAPHGGALANMVFAPVNTSVIEFTPLAQIKAQGGNERPCYFGLAHALGFSYYIVEPSEFNFDHGSMFVPVDRLTAVAKQVHADIQLTRQ